MDKLEEAGSGGVQWTFKFGAPSLDANGQAVDKTLALNNIDNKPKPAKVNSDVANNQATNDSVMPTAFLSHPSIKIFDSKDINSNFDKAEDAKDIEDKDWEGLEDNDDNKTTRDSINPVQQAKSFFSPSFSLLSSVPFSFSFFPIFSYLKSLHKYGKKANKAFDRYLWPFCNKFYLTIWIPIQYSLLSITYYCDI